MKTLKPISLIFLLLIAVCTAKKDKEIDKVTLAPAPAPVQAPVEPPTKAPVQAPANAPDGPSDGTVTMKLKKLIVKFESNDGSPIIIDRKGIEQLAEDYLSEYITESLDKEDPIRDAFKEADITVEVASARRKLRSLQQTGAVAEIGGSITFDEDGAPDASTVEDLQEKVFTQSWLQSELKAMASGDPTVTVLPTNGEEETLGGGGNKTGGAVGGVVGAFAFVGVAAFAFMQYKKRKTGKGDICDASYDAPEVFVGAEYGKDGDEHFEAVMSPTFSLQESARSVKSARAVRKGYTMPRATRVNSFTSKKSGMSVGGDYDDTYSLDGSTALGHNPNPGDKMLDQVLAMSNYTPASDITCLNDGTSTGKTTTVLVHVVSKMTSALGDDESAFPHSNDYEFDSPSVLGGGMSVSANSMMSENVRSNGRSLTIGEKKNFNASDNNVGGDLSDDESSADGIEVAIDRLSEADSESVFGDIDTPEVPAPATRPTLAIAAVKKIFTPTETLNFVSKSEEDFKVNIVETENAKKPTSMPIPAVMEEEEPVASMKSLIPWSSRQVQRVEQNHKVTITTEPSAPTWVKSHYPTQAAQKALADDSSQDDDSYSSYYSSGNEEEAVSKLLRAAKERGRQPGRQPIDRTQQKPIQQKPTQQNTKANEPAAKRNVVSSNVNFPIRSPPPVQHHQATSPSLSFSAKSTGSPTLKSPYELKSKGISNTNYAAEARRNRIARRTTKDDDPREDAGKESISNQVASLRKARLQQRSRN